MTDDRAPIDDLLRTALRPYDQSDLRGAATRADALAELRHSHRGRSWRYRLEAGAMMTAAAAQLVWVVGSLFGG
ncbi:MAG: hypothetical protein IPL61_23670 [Myxococcales bacterium]|nr:hypothetical protein [Myxococcales bacterium]